MYICACVNSFLFGVLSVHTDLWYMFVSVYIYAHICMFVYIKNYIDMSMCIHRNT